MPSKHGPGPLISAEDIGDGDGIALFLSGAFTQLHLPFSSPLVIQLLLRTSDGCFWTGEFSSATFPLAGPPTFCRWDPATLPRHFWSVAELTPNRLRGSSQLAAQESLLRLGVVRRLDDGHDGHVGDGAELLQQRLVDVPSAVLGQRRRALPLPEHQRLG